MPPTDGWRVGVTEYEGIPLAFRYPISVNPDSPTPTWTALVEITIPFTDVKDNGLPTPEHNRALSPLDHSLRDLYREDDVGHVALIETYGGARTYWFYARKDIDHRGRIAKALAPFPTTAAEIEVSGDPTWSFLREYAKRFSFSYAPIYQN